MDCLHCGLQIANLYERKPIRHFCSPGSAGFKSKYCSIECANRHDKETYSYLAELDRNCNDCEHFEPEGWREVKNGDRALSGGKWLISTKLRFGKCKNKDLNVEAEPLNPDFNECFKLRLKHKR